jgi:RNA polymerase sigma-70 factor (ECF subfamily)
VVNSDCESADVVSLVRHAQDGSEPALEALISRYQNRVAGFVYSLVGRDEALEDICQEVFLKMISGLPQLKVPDSFEPWLFRIARNSCADFIRWKRLWRSLVPFEQKHEQVTSYSESQRGETAAFSNAIENLPRAQKELILLLADGDWSYEDLAEITGSTVSSVKSRLFRAREFMRKRLTDDED